jgi:hypothetical protein
MRALEHADSSATEVRLFSLKGTGFRVCVRTANLHAVPQGRLSLAQDVVLGGLTQIAIVPQGRLVQPLQAEDKL